MPAVVRHRRSGLHISPASLAVQASPGVPQRLRESGGALRVRLLARGRSAPGRGKVGRSQRILWGLADGSPGLVCGGLPPAEMLGEELVEHFGSRLGLLAE